MILAVSGVCDPGAIKVSFLSSSSRYTCSSLDDNAVVLLLLVEGPVVVTGSDGVATKLVSTDNGLVTGLLGENFDGILTTEVLVVFSLLRSLVLSSCPTGSMTASTKMMIVFCLMMILKATDTLFHGQRSCRSTL